MGKRDGECEPGSGCPPHRWCFLHPEKPGLGNRVGKTESWYVFLLICLLNTAPPPRKLFGEECGHRSLGPHHLPGDVCVEGVASGPVLVWLHIPLDLRKGGRGRRESEETCVQRCWSWISSNPLMACFASYCVTLGRPTSPHRKIYKFS